MENENQFKNQLIPIDEYGLFVDRENIIRVDSRYIAEYFKEPHKTVLKNIDAILAKNSGFTQDFRQNNFVLTTYTDYRNRKKRCYTLTRDGFIALAMKFTGKEAAHFKKIYIHKFNDMEKNVKAIMSTRQEFPLLAANIRLAYDNPKPYHYSNECNMINRIVLGMTSKQYKITHDIPSNESIRPYLSKGQIKLLNILQTVDIGLLLSVPDCCKREQFLESYVMKKYRSLATTCSD